MEDQEQNRSEAATPFKLDEARKRGSVPKSLDANSFLILLAATIALRFWGPDIANRELRLFEGIFSNAHQASFDGAIIGTALIGLIFQALALTAPAVVLIVVVAILANFMQVGPVFSFTPLKPDLDRINPIAGFKRLFSLRLLMDAAKTMLKFVVLGAVLYYALLAARPMLYSSLHMEPAAVAHAWVPEVTTVLFKLLAALALITLLDFVFSRWDFGRKMRMSRREVKDEVKRREGDPRIKARLRDLQREALKRAQSVKRVKDADVLITNPIRLAIAIKYDRDSIDAPLVVAKGAGLLARQMRDAARKHFVPVVENRTLARALFHRVGIDQLVPDEHYSVLARILVWAYAMRGKSATGAATP